MLGIYEIKRFYGVSPIPNYNCPVYGAILKCHFDGFIDPEMIKERPVIIVARPAAPAVKYGVFAPLLHLLLEPRIGISASYRLSGVGLLFF